MRLSSLFLLNAVIAPITLAAPSSQQQPNPPPSLDLLSLSDLLKIDKVSDVKNYAVSDTVSFDQGRLLLGQQGSLWTKNKLSLQKSNEFTYEVVFRSSGKSNDIQFRENGLNVWLVDDRSPKTAKSGLGSEVFDGFKFAVNNRDQQGLKIFNNDGNQRVPAVDDSLELSLGDCQFRYLESDVPFTLRISYSANKNWFKVQVDNNLCFKTDQIQLPPKSDWVFGITSVVNSASKELFEILEVNVWDKLTEDAVDDHGLMDGEELKVDVEEKVVNNEGGEKAGAIPEHASPAQIRQSLMERARQHREETAKANGGNNNNNNNNNAQKQNEPRISTKLAPTGDSIQLVLNKLDQLEIALADLSASSPRGANENSQGGGSGGVSVQVQETKDILVELRQTFITQYAELLQAIQLLNQKVIGEVREQHVGMEEISKKVDLLMNEHKEVQHQYINHYKQQERQKAEGISIPGGEKESNSDTLADKLIKWVLIPLMIVLLALVVFVYRLRHDIKHSKLL